jgi:hypothetical protein
MGLWQNGFRLRVSIGAFLVGCRGIGSYGNMGGARAGPEIWVAQARPNVGCPLLLNIKKKLMQNQGYIVCFFLD